MWVDAGDHSRVLKRNVKILGLIPWLAGGDPGHLTMKGEADDPGQVRQMTLATWPGRVRQMTLAR